MRLLSVLALVALSMPAAAADADPYVLAGSMAYGQGSLSVESPFLSSNPGLAGGMMANVAEDLAVVTFSDGHSESLLGTTLNTTFQGSYTWSDRARFDLFLPLYPYAEAPLQDFQGFALGDVILQGIYPVYGGETLAAAVGLSVGLPTGSADPLLGRGPHATLKALVGGQLESGVGYAANAAFVIDPADTIRTVAISHSADLGLATWYSLDAGLRVGGEATLSVGLAGADGTSANTLGTSNLFVQLLNPSGLSMTLGSGTGFIPGVGSPDYRLFAGLSWAKVRSDVDADGLEDRADGCPEEAEDLDGFQDSDGCPERDNDGDGVSDVGDSCMNEAEDLDNFQDGDGCPDPDNDGDGFLDADDACPEVAGTVGGCLDSDGDGLTDADDACPNVAGDVAHQGCADSDSDGLLDADDACPKEAGPADEDPARANGCPKAIYLTSAGISGLEELHFPSNDVALSPAHKLALDGVAAWMKAAPYVLKLEVGGHTDDKETRAERVSLQRAEAAVSYLVSKGVPAARLVAKGYAGAEPLGTNRTATGRDKNRRIGWKVLETTPPPARPVAKVAPPPKPVTAAKATEATAAAPTLAAVAAPDAADAPSTLSVVLYGHRVAQVWIDDVQITATAPFKGHQIPGGVHTIRVMNPAEKLDVTKKIRVTGSPVVVEIGDPPKAAESDAPWAESAEPAVETALPWGEATTPATPPAEAAKDGADPWAVPWLEGEGAPAQPEEKKKKRRDR